MLYNNKKIKWKAANEPCCSIIVRYLSAFKADK